MSKLGKKPVPIPDGVKLLFSNNKLKAEGPKGSAELSIPDNMQAKIDTDKKIVSMEAKYNIPHDRVMHGTIRSLVNNMLIGVSKGYEKKLDIIGTGYNAKIQGKELIINIGFSHPVKMVVPQGINVTVPNPNQVLVQGINKELVGLFASQIRFIKVSEPYNLKGIKYTDEIIRRKSGKTFVSGTA
ncbi:MAG: 50S ribosomal protein L6 [Planctomycetota bacterium]